MKWMFIVVLLFCQLTTNGQESSLTAISASQGNSTDLFYNLLKDDSKSYEQSLNEIDDHWDKSYLAPLIEMLILVDKTKVKNRIIDLLEKHTGQSFGKNIYDWWEWLWSQPTSYAPYFADLKGRIYRNIDHKFETYFTNRHDLSEIRLDEILWGGVRQDGIPPLRDPEMIDAEQARYLFKSDIVFGIVVNGIAKAYPKRILGWHEMVVDNFGDTRVAGVYCTLCGTMIAYDMNYNGKYHDLGTSGFLYRSNKLMYDRATQSLWNTIEGRPVVGPLTKENIELNIYPVITSSWEAWLQAHPNTKVLSLNTGHNRNYNSGAAYRSYYATDDLMFPVPLEDNRLKNKDEVLVIRAEGFEKDPLAISIDFLGKHPIHKDQFNGQNIAIITSKKGGSRAYFTGNVNFKSYNDGVLIDEDGTSWNVTEESILNVEMTPLNRIPTHNIFWFAWYNAYPETRLVK